DVDLAAVMNFVLGHQAEPFADTQLGAARRYTPLLEVLIAKSAQYSHRLLVEAAHVREDRVVAVGQLPAVSGIAARPQLSILDEHPAFDAAKMAKDVAERELAGLVRPLDSVGWNAGCNAHRPLAHAIEVLGEIIHEEPSCALPFARPSAACPRRRASG